jgi:hypothetical protein
MPGTVKKSFNTPDELRKPPNIEVAVVNLGPVTAARFTMQPGWRWSESVGPVAGTDTCQARHIGVVASGRLRISHGDSDTEIGPGDAYVIEPGHDAVVVGDDPFMGYEFDSATAEVFAQPSS